MLDVEKGDERQRVEESLPAKANPRFPKYCIISAIVLLLTLILGISLGLTQMHHPSKTTSNASQDDQSKDNSISCTKGDVTCQDEDGSNEVSSESLQTFVQFQSTERAYNVTMNLLSSAVLEGYKNVNDLKSDLIQALQFYLNSFIEEQIKYGRNVVYQPMGEMEMSMAGGDDAPKGTSATGKTDYQTNNQNIGVDEADMIKSDGTYVYAAYGDVLVVWNAVNGSFVTNYTLPAINTSVIQDGNSISTKPDMGFIGGMYAPKAYINGMSLEANRLFVYVSGYGSEVVANKNITTSCFDAFATRVLVFDVSNPMTLITWKDIQGSFRDARALNGNIYLVTMCSFNFPMLTENLYIYQDEFINMTDNAYRKSVVSKAKSRIDSFVDMMIADINSHGTAHIPKISLWGSRFGNDTSVIEQAYSGGAIQSYTSLISFSVSDLGDDFKVSSAGAFTPSSWGYTYVIDGWVVFAAQGWDWISTIGGTAQSTHLMGFKVDGTETSPAWLGSFPGYILNQYSLSVYDGYIRVATTVDSWFADSPMSTATERNESASVTSSSNQSVSSISDISVTWSSPISTVQNQVIILKIPASSDKKLEEVSRISNLGEEGERFTAVNYFGRIAYVVTFLQTDPLYVLDLDPSKPSVLGELKVTGFSTYLHSINKDDTLLVGVGEEADETGGILGLKVSLFDATDPSSPKQLKSITVEKDKETWSSSDATFDFKAFRWLNLGDETGLLILPVRVESWTQDQNGNFDGFYVYDVSRDGISLRMTISHVQSQDFFGCYASATLPQRSMVFNGNVMTVKGHSILSTNLDSGKKSWSLEMPKPENQDSCMYW